MRPAGCTAARNNVLRITSRSCVRRSHTFRRTFVPSSNDSVRHDYDGLGPTDPSRRSNPLAKQIAVLGGGITGLSTAYHILRYLPGAKITLYEASDRLGGWLNSETIDLEDGQVVFEWGPRTLRPDLNGSGRATLDLLTELGMAPEIVATRKDQPAALNRYVYYPDHLVAMPAAPTVFGLIQRFLAVFTEPIFKGLYRGIIREPRVPLRDESVEDESVGSFIERRFGKVAADNFVSAVFHGIYAGDIYKISARTTMARQWFLERKEGDEGAGILLEVADIMLKQLRLYPEKIDNYWKIRRLMQGVKVRGNHRLQDALKSLSASSVYTLQKGLGSLAAKLGKNLEGNPNVTIRTNSRVIAVNAQKQGDRLAVKVDEEASDNEYDYVVSCLPPKAVQLFLEQSAKSRGTSVGEAIVAACNHVDRSVNVMVVNLYYSKPDLIPPEYAGFGYLIPRSVPFEQNPERALGVLFSSESSGPRGQVRTRQVKRSQLRDSLELLEAARDRHEEEFRTLIEMSGDGFQAGAIKGAHEQQLREFVEAIEDVRKTQADLFGTDEAKEIAEIEYRLGQDTAPGTKLTVMMGGHWWDGWERSDLPSEEEAITMATTVLQRHLGITAKPEVAKARLAENCIPQYPVGYRKAMARIHDGLMTEYKGRFKVAGPWWQGAVGVNDCIRKAEETSWAIREQWDDKTGLEEYTRDEGWFLSHPSTGQKSAIGKRA